jgi:hypothetical protein
MWGVYPAERDWPDAVGLPFSYSFIHCVPRKQFVEIGRYMCAAMGVDLPNVSLFLILEQILTPQPRGKMPLPAGNLRAFIQETLDGSISPTDLTKFVQLSRGIVTAHISIFRASTTILCDKLGLTSTDLAYDCIAEAFARDEAKHFLHIKRFVESLSEKLETISDAALLAAFRGFLCKFTDVQIGRLYALADPAGTKIYRNIRECIEREGRFEIHKDFRGWVASPSGKDDTDHLPPCPIEDLRVKISARTGPNDKVPRFLQILFDEIATLEEYRRSITMTDIVLLYKTVYRIGQGGPENVGSAPAVNSLEPFEIDQLRRDVEQSLKEKIFITYVARGKMTRDEAQAMFLAISDLIGDWCSGNGEHIGLHEYLHRHLELDEQAYRDQFRVKMEYMMRLAREDFACRLMREL